MEKLTKATNILLKYYHLWRIFDNEIIIEYNNHKLRHSNWVLEIWRQILLWKEFNKLDQKIKWKSEICFLLHDLWRFYQNNKKRIKRFEKFKNRNW